MSPISRIVASTLLLTSAAALPGCILAAAAVGAGIGYGAYEYANGDLEANIKGTPTEVAAAATATLKDLQLPILSSDATGVDAHIVALTAGDKKVKVNITTRSESASHVEIRVGTFGDEDLSRRIFDGIKSRLK